MEKSNLKACCFIDHCNIYLLQELEKRGYQLHPSCKTSFDSPLYIGRGFYSSIPIGYTEEINLSVDCKDNEDLFLALASMTYGDSTNVGEYYIVVSGDQDIFPIGYISKSLPFLSNIHPGHYRKATSKELVKWFSDPMSGLIPIPLDRVKDLKVKKSGAICTNCHHYCEEIDDIPHAFDPVEKEVYYISTCPKCGEILISKD